MRIAVSNIAWRAGQDDEAAAAMRAGGAGAVEIAPTAVWPDPWATTPADRAALRGAWAARGFPVVALQSLLYGHGHLQLFDAGTRPEMADRLEGMMAIAADLGARALVLGSPRNRLRGDRPFEDAVAEAAPILARLGAAAERRGVCLCIEPNPPQYGCDFVTTAAEGRALVERVASPGFCLHLDAAAMHLAGDDLAAEIARSLPLLAHFHFSAPQLAAVDERSPVDYRAAARALRAGGYRHDVSIEMRQAERPELDMERVGAALRCVRGAVEEER